MRTNEVLRVVASTVGITLLLGVTGCSAPTGGTVGGGGSGTVVVSTVGIRVETLSSASQEFEYFAEDADELVAALSRVFGAKPMIVPYEGSSHSTPGSVLDWGGLAIEIHEGEIKQAIGYPRFTAVVTRAAVRGVPIQTADGVAVGEEAAEVAAVADSSQEMSVAVGWDADGTQYSLDEIAIEGDPGATYPGPDARYRTMIIMLDGQATVTRFTAPEPNFSP